MASYPHSHFTRLEWPNPWPFSLFLHITVNCNRGCQIFKQVFNCRDSSVAWVFGGMIFAFVYCTTGISGGHINLAVTFRLLLARQLSLIRTIFYMIMQCLEVICGAAVVKSFQKTHYEKLGGGANIVSSGYSKSSGFGAEIVGTFVFVYTVFFATNAKRNAQDSHVPILAPLPIEFAVFLVHLATILITRTSINLTKSLGAAFAFASWLGIVVCLIFNVVAGIVYWIQGGGVVDPLCWGVTAELFKGSHLDEGKRMVIEYMKPLVKFGGETLIISQVAAIATRDLGVEVELFDDTKAGVKVCTDRVLDGMNKCIDGYGVTIAFAFGATFYQRTKQRAALQKKKKLIRSLKDLQILKDHLKIYTSDYTIQVLVGYCLAYIFMQTFMIPGTVFTSFLIGVQSGVFKGVAVVVITATTDAASCFFLSRSIGRPLVFSL